MTNKRREAELQKSCAGCGEPFACGAADGKCWCFEIALTEETLAKLREKFENCLCEKCLKSREPNTKSPHEVGRERREYRE